MDAYLIARADWDVTTLAKHAVPAEVLEMADHSLAEEAELPPAAAEGTVLHPRVMQAHASDV